MFEIQEKERFVYWLKETFPVFRHRRVWEHVSYHSRYEQAKREVSMMRAKPKNCGYLFRWLDLRYARIAKRFFAGLVLFAAMTLVFCISL